MGVGSLVSGYNRPPLPQPPWSQVIATTIRLWWRRHVAEPAARADRRRRYRQAGIGALIVALLAVSAVAVRLATSHSSAADPARAQGQHSESTADTERLAAATASRQQAAAWIAAQVGRNVIVSCDPLMCTALSQDGFPAANLASLGPSAADPLGSGIVVSTAAIRNELGTRLASVYAPLVIAAFGTGQNLVQVRVVAPDGAAAYLGALKADVQARQAAGRELLANKNVRTTAVARGQLAAGQVDVRLLITLVGLAHKYRIAIRSFGDAGPGAAPGVPLRSMTITAPTPTYRRQVQAFLRAQRAPLLALTSVQQAGKAVVLTIEFPAPAPLGLLNQN
jgi:hypothetical protein